MKISVITVCYNSAKTIADTIASVAGQSYDDVEHIIVDGASRDETAEIIKNAIGKIAGRDIKFISEPDKGIYDAMNKGVAVATGDVIAVLNSDDIYASEHILQIVADQMTEEGAEEGGCPSKNSPSPNTFLGGRGLGGAGIISDFRLQTSDTPHPTPPPQGGRENLFGGKEIRLEALLGDVGFFKDGNPDKIIRRYDSGCFTPGKAAYGWMPAHPAMFLRREVYERTGKYRTDYKIAADFEFIVRAFVKNNVRYKHFPEILVKMRVGGVSTSGIKSMLLINKEVLRACSENGVKTNMLKIMSKYPKKILGLFKK